MIREIIDVVRPPCADELAKRELDHSRRLLLESQKCLDYYGKMVEFYECRINRLTHQLKDKPEGESCGGTSLRSSWAPGAASS